MARRYADIQAELLQAAGSDISPQLKLMVPHITILKMTIEAQENLLAAREPGFDPDNYGVMVDRLSTFFKQARPPGRPSSRGRRLSPEAHAALLRGTP
jgi:hypothetical protein